MRSPSSSVINGAAGLLGLIYTSGEGNVISNSDTPSPCGNGYTPFYCAGPAAIPEDAVLRGHESVAAPYMQEWKELVDKHLELSTQYHVTKAEICRQEEVYKELVSAVERGGNSNGSDPSMVTAELVRTLDTLDKLRQTAEGLWAAVTKKQDEIASCVNGMVGTRASFRNYVSAQPWLWNPGAAQLQYAPSPWYYGPQAAPQTGLYSGGLYPVGLYPGGLYPGGQNLGYQPQSIYEYSSPYVPYPPAWPPNTGLDDDVDDDLDDGLDDDDDN